MATETTDPAVAIIKQLSELSPEALKDPETRKAALKSSRILSTVLDDPHNTAIELVFQPFIEMAARASIDLNLFDQISKSNEPISTEKLAAVSGGEVLLINRLLRVLASIGFVSQTGAETWAPTPITHAVAVPHLTAGHRFVWDFMIASAVKAPQFLRETGQRCPSSTTDGFVQFAHHSKLNCFALMESKPNIVADFNTFMKNSMGGRKYWVEWFPISEQVVDGFDPSDDAALLVDVGGGKGHDVQAFHNLFPGKGRLVLQDLPQGLKGISADELDPAIERMEYDFFTEQPVKGARAYFLHHILHNWPEEYCLRILARLRAAMKPGYSKLLLHELVLPDVGATTFPCIFDMVMMTLNGAMERNRTQWTSLLAAAGFKIEGFYVRDPDEDGILVAVPDTEVVDT